MTLGLILDSETNDLLIDGRCIALGRPQTTIATIVTTANRGELKELPLIGGEANRQLGSPRQALWLTRLRKQLVAVGLKVKNLAVDSRSNAIQMEVE
ncbi:MAG: hypothetical protein E7069_03595 [Bacteroidales bacterium]|nr:hypothetical protein [Bacteroidales bacterium]